MSSDPLRISLEEQLTRMRGGGPLPGSLLDVEASEFDGLTVIKPRDWDELRHEEGGEGRSAPYWALLWPSSRALAEALLEEVAELEGKRVLELGCGLALPSLVAARAGAQVLASDGSPDAVVFAAHNVEALLRLLPRLIGDEGEALIADPSRAGGRDFAASAKRIFLMERRAAAGHERVNLLRLRPRKRATAP